MPVATPPRFGQVPLRDRRDSEILAEEAEGRGDVVLGGGPNLLLHRYNLLHRAKISKIEKLQIPAQGDVLFALSQKDLNAYSLILYLLDSVSPADEIFVTTFNINRDITRAFAGLVDHGLTQRLSIVISQSIESRMPERIAELRALWETRQEKMRVSLCWNHSKICLLKTSSGDAFVVTGSGNYSFNAEIEQYEIWNSPSLFDWLRETLEKRCFQSAGMKTKIWGQDVAVA